MDEIYVNVKCDKPVGSNTSQNQRGPRSSQRRFHGCVVLCLGLLNVFLLAGLIGLGLHHHVSVQHPAAELSTIEANQTEFSHPTERRDLLKARINEMTEEQLEKLSDFLTNCPPGWTKFKGACYLLSSQSASWDKGREDCRGRGADLVVIDSSEEQMFLSEFTKKDAWIGLNDRDEEGTWKWIDGTPLNLTFWAELQPDNGAGDPRWGEEDCVHFKTLQRNLWNDFSCNASLLWICEKKNLQCNLF